VMMEFEKILIKEKPDMVVLVGDINSTLAGAIASVKLHIPVAHIEAGVRSGDRTMPEEINRLLTDLISDYLFTPSTGAGENLKREGVPESKIFAVGNVMVDSLLHNKSQAERSEILAGLGLKERAYSLLTLHRAANVDDVKVLTEIAGAVREIARDIPVVFPAHPRTQKNIEAFGIEDMFEDERIIFIKPQGYIHFLKLLMCARFVLTDSGGVEPETTVLGVPCLTLMNSTAWQETVTSGTNTLVGSSAEKIVGEARKILDGNVKSWSVPELWDGKAAERIVRVLAAV
jgi:UDP-N-acetylglucosamine 2-epimerase (non-hydrolysing)